MEKPFMTPHCATGIFPVWIRASEALPDSCRDVLVTDGGFVLVGSYQESWHGDGYRWECTVSEYGFDSVITHWMELPPIPEL